MSLNNLVRYENKMKNKTIEECKYNYDRLMIVGYIINTYSQDDRHIIQGLVCSNILYFRLLSITTSYYECESYFTMY